MFEFFDTILGYIELLMNSLVSLVEAAFQALVLVASSANFAILAASYMPRIIASAVIIFVSISVIKSIFGR